MKPLLCVIIVFSFFSCGESTSEKVSNAIEDANIFLTSRNCTGALEILNEVGMQNTNKDYLSTLASTYACYANYSTTTFFANDIATISAADEEGFVASLVTFSTSDDMTSATDSDFVFLQRGIDTLLYAGGLSTPSSAGREAEFSSQELLDINTQALYMIFVNFGRWLNFYGNASATGVKGGGAGANSCIATYTDANAITAIDAVGGDSCNSGTNTGSTSIETAERTERLCQGIILFNNLVDTIDGIIFTGSSATDLNSVSGILNTVCTAAAAVPGSFNATMCDVRDQGVCETQANSDIERFMAAIIETIYL